MAAEIGNKQKLLSVIVPVYNVADYVERCIRSLEDQDIPNNDYEIICINDGSTDTSREIIVNLQKEFENITLIDQENQGVSRARNNGIDIAAGRYLMFIDSDDYVEKKSFASILRNADYNKSQVSFLGFSVIDEGKTMPSIPDIKRKPFYLYPGIEAYLLARVDVHNDPDRMVAVLFEKEFIDLYALRYLPGVPYLEDGEFIARILCLAERCIFDNHPFYLRTSRPGSATNSNLFHSGKATKGFLLAASNLKRFQQEESLSERQRLFLNQPICKFAVLVVSSAQRPFNLKRINEARARLSRSGLYKLDLDNLDKEYTRLGYFYNKSIFVLILIQLLDKAAASIRSRILKLFIRSARV